MDPNKVNDIDLQRDLEKLDTPVQHPIVVYKEGMGKKQTLSKGLENEDLKIVERLEKLNKGPAQVPSDTEMEARLAKLKVDLSDPNKDLKVQVRLGQPKKTDWEQANSLLDEMQSQVSIENRHHGEEDNSLLNRLDKLRNPISKGIVPKASASGISPEEFLKSQSLNSRQPMNLYENVNENDEVDTLVKKYMDEAKLHGTDESSSSDTTESDNKNPWCILCNEDAAVRCYDCDDVYCKYCFEAFHADQRDHLFEAV